MKRFFLFAAPQGQESRGATSFVGDFESASEALVGVLDLKFVSEFWHILDTETGEVVDRTNIKTQQAMLGFQKSDWNINEQKPEGSALTSTAPAKSAPIKLASTTGRETAQRGMETIAKGLETALGVKPNAQTNGAHAE